MASAFLNDLAQRLITGNKWEQRRNLERKLQDLCAAPGEKVLDFGCGTGLFFPPIHAMGLQYFGYDIDENAIRYASRLYSAGRFFSAFDSRRAFAPYDIILANCCFHHLEDATLSRELQNLRDSLAPGGRFLLIDLLLEDEDNHFLRRQFRKLERGAFVRSETEYDRLVEPYFVIRKKEEIRSHVFSLKGNPIYGRLAIFECAPYA